MIRRGRWKFVHSPADPDQLYDLAADPHERTNLATAGSMRERVAAFRAEVAAALGPARLDCRRAGEPAAPPPRRRRAGTGRPAPWDFQPPRDASREYVRNHMDLDELEATGALPARAPDGNTP